MKFALLCAAGAWIPLFFAGSGCSSTSGSEAPAAPQPTLLRMVDYRSGARLELVNPAHTPAVSQYSTVRQDASRKVTSEEWMAGLLDFLEDQGWSEEEQAGSAPAMASGTLRWSLERTGPGGTVHVAAPMDVKGARAKRLLTLQAAFVDTYNATPGFQSVSAEPGKLPFKVPEWQAPPKKDG